MATIDMLEDALRVLNPCAEVNTFKNGDSFGAYLVFSDPLRRDGPVSVQIGFAGSETDDRDEFRDLVENQIVARRIRAEMAREDFEQ